MMIITYDFLFCTYKFDFKYKKQTNEEIDKEIAMLN